MTKRVACIGDSLTWGYSLPDSRRQSYPAPIRMFRVMGMTFGGLSPKTLEEGVWPVIHEVAEEYELQCIDLVDVFTDARY